MKWLLECLVKYYAIRRKTFSPQISQMSADGDFTAETRRKSLKHGGKEGAEEDGE
jgi:hypothetical protein